MRVTRDVDVVAMADADGLLVDPAPLPKSLVVAADEVATDLGLPDGFASRLTWKNFGENLTAGFIGRYDQIHFKLYAAVDQAGSYHAADLHELAPTDEELLAASAWSRTHDPSEGYLESLKWFLREFGYGHLVERL